MNDPKLNDHSDDIAILLKKGLKITFLGFWLILFLCVIFAVVGMFLEQIGFSVH